MIFMHEEYLKIALFAVLHLFNNVLRSQLTLLNYVQH